MEFTLFLGCLVLACAVMVGANSGIHFAVLSLVFMAVFGSCLVVVEGGSFMPLVVLLVYLGGLLVVFAFCVGFTDDPFGAVGVSKGFVLFCWVGLLVGGVWVCGHLWGWWVVGVSGLVDVEVVGGGVADELLGVGLMYSSGWGFVVICGWALLVTLLVITGLVRGCCWGSLRPF
uniref:NADH-ubiquinone oxidoreductase chain 6 n=1 Tax=Paleosuchus trigonatus TaxID=38658 RepID=A7DWQ1_PALTR|nr:NADH dehydrogenase subunit 6 [Paleosuchus trigonatus]CAM35783.1 NADH dehydrogenase subunit 6 [Paleosuchus trigonatus]